MYSSEHINDDIFDSILTSAFNDYINKQIENEPTDDELAEKYPIPKNGLKRILKAIKEQKYHRPMYIVYLQRVAVTVLILAATVFSLLMSNSKIRAAVTDVIIEWYNTHIKIEFTSDPSDDTETTPISEYSLQIGYIPEGFELVDTIDYEEQFKSYTYRMGDKYIQIELNKFNIGNYMFDIEQYKCDNTIINGLTAYVLSNNKDDTQTSVIWGNKLYTLILDACLNTNEAIKIAENINIIKK